MKIIFLGCTGFSADILNALIDNGIKINTVFSLPEFFKISYSKKLVKNFNYSNLKKITEKNSITYFEINSEQNHKLSNYYDYFNEIKPDLVLVMGWYHMIPKKIRDIAKYGTWGIHASLLPNYAGGAPLVWAIIQGEKETGVTLFRLGGGVDDGDIISQEKFCIDETDTIKEVYEKATSISQKILIESINNIENIDYKPQNKSKIQIYPQRNPDDGQIDLNWNSDRIFNFIRAQVSPYPGAFIKTSDGKKLFIEKVRIEK